MKLHRLIALGTCVAALFATAAFAAPKYVQVKPMSELVQAAVGDVKDGPRKLPVITWGADIRTVYANGNVERTAKGSLFDQLGLDLQLVREDVFARQLESYLRGDTPYLRGTMGMINMALDALGGDPRAKPVVIYQLSWSAGGDALVVKPGIKAAQDLKGKTIALQAYGPHVDYLGKLLKDAGLSFADVNLVWLPDLTGTDNTPMAAFYEGNVDAALVIIPDALLLSSGGNVGSGAEGSVKGAKILLSTKTANRIIADVYAVRSDFLKAHPDEVQTLVHGLMKAQEAMAKLVASRATQADDYRNAMRGAAKLLLDSPDAVEDTEAMYADAEHVDYAGNVKFFTDTHYPRGMERLTAEIQAALAPLGLTGGQATLGHANLDYNALRSGLTRLAAAESPRFDSAKVATVVAKKQQQGTLGDDALFDFEVFFQPNQKSFSADMYQTEFDQVIDYAFTYGGALITVEGHSDPMQYLKLKKKGASEVELRRTRQSAKNLSLARAMAVRDAVIEYAAGKGVPLDPTQFAVVGQGIEAPKSGVCGADPCAPQNEQQWRDNMRVQFRIIQVEAEAEVFQPL